MTLTMHVQRRVSNSFVYGKHRVFQYRVYGLPDGEHALIAEFHPRGWRILRWNDSWHGNWTGSFSSADEALEALRNELVAA